MRKKKKKTQDGIWMKTNVKTEQGKWHSAYKLYTEIVTRRPKARIILMLSIFI